MEGLGNWAKNTLFQSEGCWNGSEIHTCSTATLNFPDDICDGR